MYAHGSFSTSKRPQRVSALSAPGFIRFQLMRPLRNQEYLVVTEWGSEQAFKDWIGSDLFKEAHRGDGQRSFGGHSELRTYDVIDVEQRA